MCKFAKNWVKVVAVLAAIAGVFAIVFHFLQKKEAMVDETIDSLDEFEFEEDVFDEETGEEPELPKRKKRLYRRSYISIPFHEV